VRFGFSFGVIQMQWRKEVWLLSCIVMRITAPNIITLSEKEQPGNRKWTLVGQPEVPDNNVRLKPNATSYISEGYHPVPSGPIVSSVGKAAQ
jgi:hypothetical protein